MINEKSAMTVWWCKRMYSLTSWALWRKTISSCRRTVCWQGLHTRSNLVLRLKRPIDVLGHVVELPLRKRYNVFAEGCWLGLSPTLVVEKTGPKEEQAILSLKISSLFAVRLFCALSAQNRFMHVFSLLELLTVAVQSMFLDNVGVTRVWNWRLVH